MIIFIPEGPPDDELSERHDGRMDSARPGRHPGGCGGLHVRSASRLSGMEPRRSESEAEGPACKRRRVTVANGGESSTAVDGTRTVGESEPLESAAVALEPAAPSGIKVSDVTESRVSGESSGSVDGGLCVQDAEAIGPGGHLALLDTPAISCITKSKHDEERLVETAEHGEVRSEIEEDEDDDDDQNDDDVVENEGEDGSNESDLSEVDSSDDDDEDRDSDALAFLGELKAHLATGVNMKEAVRRIFAADEKTTDPSKVGSIAFPTQPGAVVGRRPAVAAALAQVSAELADPVISALDADPALVHRPRDVAQLCAAVYRLAEEDIHDAVVSSARPRLELGITGLADVARMVDKARNIVVLSGAGVSVSCGIPDFRSKDGVYEKVLQRYGLSDPQSIFDLEEFRIDPTLFFSFAKDIMPSEDIKPSPTHYFISELEKRGKLLRNYSQNIDGLEHRAGISPERVILCHGSFLTATCMRPSCRTQVPGSTITEDVLAGNVPRCRACSRHRTSGRSRSNNDGNDDDNEDDEEDWSSVIKPDIVFFGESLPKSVAENLERDIPVADLVLVLGTSLKVAPVARIPQQFPDAIPRLLVNRELVGYNFDVELLGDCDGVIAELRHKLQWERAADEEDAYRKAGCREGSAGGSDESKDTVAMDSRASSVAESVSGKPDYQMEARQEGDGSEKGVMEHVQQAKASGGSGRILYEFCPPRRFLFPGAMERKEVSSESEESSVDPEERDGSGLASLYEGAPTGLAEMGAASEEDDKAHADIAEEEGNVALGLDMAGNETVDRILGGVAGGSETEKSGAEGGGAADDAAEIFGSNTPPRSF